MFAILIKCYDGVFRYFGMCDDINEYIDKYVPNPQIEFLVYDCDWNVEPWHIVL